MIGVIQVYRVVSHQGLVATKVAVIASGTSTGQESHPAFGSGAAAADAIAVEATAGPTHVGSTFVGGIMY